jgi:hypothetical protein
MSNQGSPHRAATNVREMVIQENESGLPRSS